MLVTHFGFYLIYLCCQDDALSSPRSDRSSASSERFAPPQDPNLAAARSLQQRTPSPSSTLLPSRISSPGSRIGRLHQQSGASGGSTAQTGLRRPTMIASPRSSAVPTASVTIGPGSGKKSIIRRPRSGTQGSSNSNHATTNSATSGGGASREARDRQLHLLREQQQQRLRDLQEQREQYERDEQARLTANADIADEEQDVDNESTKPEDEDEDEDEEDETPATPPQQQDLQQQQQQQQQPAAPQSASVYGTLAPSMPVSKSEQTVPMKDYEELRLKLKILETKRQEDRERHRENEKVKEEAEQFLTLRNKLQGNALRGNERFL